VLSPDGIRQRLSHGRILHIPWDEVQGVVSVDQTVMNVLGFYQTILNVPAVVVSEAFYDRVMPLQPWSRRPLNWGHFAEARKGTVRVLFRPAFLGTRGRDLRHAIETRWRAFSRHPNAKLPSREDESRARVLPMWMARWALPVILVLSALFPLYLILSPTELTEATRSAYLDDLLDKGGVTARLADGRMALLRRGDVATVSIPECEQTRSTSWMPSHVTAASCSAGLTLPSGERAVAIFRLATETQTVEYQLGKFREQSYLVTAPLSLEEADAASCRLGHCGPDSRKR
jgi:hypothetical protein